MEYVIWGIPPSQSDEILLMSQCDGEVIKDRSLAEWLANQLTVNHGCTEVRIQTVDFTTPPDFVGLLSL